MKNLLTRRQYRVKILLYLKEIRRTGGDEHEQAETERRNASAWRHDERSGGSPRHRISDAVHEDERQRIGVHAGRNRGHPGALQAERRTGHTDFF